MEKKFFNPDVQIHGDYDVDALAAAEVRARTNGEFDADICCPYDKDLCRQKIVRVLRWCDAIEYAAANRMNWTFCTRGDMFYKCPVPELNCVRQARYEQIVKQKVR